jgi:hypothetical protein
MYEECDYTLLLFLDSFVVLLSWYAVGTVYNVTFDVVGSG